MFKSIFNKIFSKERLIWLIIILILCGIIWALSSSKNEYKDNYYIAVENTKAYQQQLTNNQKEIIAFKFTIEQLQYFNDSITNKLLEKQKELDIKNDNIEQMQYIMSEFNTSDTIILSDTIFLQPNFYLDTVLGDKWMNTSLEMKYPNFISIKPTVKSEKSVIVYSEKETVNPPKKFFLCRWFQKKHTVLKIVVEEENPYIINQMNVFYDVIE
jgi:hypothetical protein